MRNPLYLLFLSLVTTLYSQNSSVAFRLSEKDLLPESIGYDSNTGAFYVGSTRKGTITMINANGDESIFVRNGQFGQWMIIGIKVDSKRNQLWFCSSGGGNLEGYTLKDEKDGRPGGVFRVDLNTGKLIKKYTLEQPGAVHFFNDLVIDENGDVYVSHMFDGSLIYKIDNDTDQLEPFAKSDLISYPNGMDISDDGKSLFVAHSDGIAKVSLETGSVKNLAIASDIALTRRASADGLYFYQNYLIAIQPGLSQVAQYRLSQPQDAIMKADILEVNHPEMDHPTTGVLVGNSFYYVANAQFEKVNEDGSLISTDEVQAPVILKLDLK